MDVSRKRQRPSAEWTIVLEDAGGLRSTLDAVKAVTQRVFFVVKKSEETGHWMLMFDGADLGMTCCVSARLRIDSVTLHREDHETEFSFCVDCKQLQTALDTPSCSHGSFEMKFMTDATIHCRMYDPEQRSASDEAKLATFVDVTEPIKLNDIFFDMKIEIDLSRLREIIKKARQSHAEHLRLQIFLQTIGSREFSVVIFSVNGDAYHCQKFAHETTRDDDGSLRVRAAADGDSDMLDVADDPKYEAMFPVDKIEAFVKVLPCRMITATVTKSSPLMMTHILGGGIASSSHNDSSVRFLIAPVNEDD